jgi:hypothetical protein
LSVAIYRNRLNDEMKRFGKFSDDIYNHLLKKGIKINVIFNDLKTECLKEIKNHDTVIIVTHGSKDALYHRYDYKYGMHQSLISINEILNNNIDVLSVLKDKKIIAIACGTTQGLAQVACNNGHCKTYLGFKHKIHFDKLNKKDASDRYHEFLIHCYKEVFSNVIEKSIEEQWKFSKFAMVLKLELRKNVTNKAKQLADRRPNFYKNHGVDQAVIAIGNVANDIEIFGDSTQLIN